MVTAMDEERPGSPDWDSTGEDGGMWLDSRFVQTVKPTGFTDEVNVAYGRKKEFKNDDQVF